MAQIGVSGGGSTGGVTMPQGWSEYGGPAGWASRSAPASAWNALITILRTSSLTGRRVVFNVSGENLPIYGAPTASGWSVKDVAKFCQQGGVFIDYCGTPMYRAQYSNTYSGFQQFITAIGAVGFPFSTFSTNTLPYSQFPYPRSLVTNGRPPQVSWFDPNLLAENARPYSPKTTVRGTSYQPVDKTNWFIYSSFALFIGKGAYFYAFGGWPTSQVGATNSVADSLFGSLAVPGVNPTTYAQFVINTLGLVGNGVQPVVTSTGGGSPAPTGGGTSTGTSTSGSGTGGTTPTTTPTTYTPTTQTPSTGFLGNLTTGEKIALGLASAGAVVGTILLTRRD